MIRYALSCDKAHEFEIWFKNSADYEQQRKRRLVTCPLCHSPKVEKALMAPQLGSGSKKGKSAPAIVAAPAEPPAAAEQPATPVMISPQEAELRAKLKELREHLTQNSDNVGAKFPEEARKMHYGETEHRSIHGIASPEEAKEMHDEGIEFHPLPILPDERN
jgi:hypothetical protein